LVVPKSIRNRTKAVKDGRKKLAMEALKRNNNAAAHGAVTNRQKVLAEIPNRKKSDPELIYADQASGG